MGWILEGVQYRVFNLIIAHMPPHDRGAAGFLRGPSIFVT